MTGPRLWRERRQRAGNEAARCRGCARMHFPPRPSCDHCGGRDFEVVPLATTGKVLTHTVIHLAPPAFAGDAPYVLVIVELDDTTRLMVQMADVAPADVSTGMRIRLEFRRIRRYGRTGIIAYAHKAVPA